MTSGNRQHLMVCGGLGLIGERITAAAIGEGHRVTIVDLPTQLDAELPGVIMSAVEAGDARLVGADLADPDRVDEVFRRIEQRSDRIDGLVNATYPRGPRYGRAFDDVDPRDFAVTVGLQTGSFFSITQRSLAHMRPHGSGSIVNLASIYATFTPRFEVYENTAMTMPVEYAVSKAGLVHFTRYVAKHALGSGVRVNCVSPGGVVDGTQPDSFVERYGAYTNSGGMLSRDALSATVLFLLGDGSASITGQDVVVDDGFTL